MDMSMDIHHTSEGTTQCTYQPSTYPSAVSKEEALPSYTKKKETLNEQTCPSTATVDLEYTADNIRTPAKNMEI